MRFWAASSMPHSGNRSAVQATHLPSGDQTGPPRPPAKLVSFDGSPPSTGIVQSCASPLRVETKPIDLPSGVNCGSVSLLRPEVIWRCSEPSAFIIQTSDQLLPASNS